MYQYLRLFHFLKIWPPLDCYLSSLENETVLKRTNDTKYLSQNISEHYSKMDFFEVWEAQSLKNIIDYRKHNTAVGRFSKKKIPIPNSSLSQNNLLFSSTEKENFKWNAVFSIVWVKPKSHLGEQNWRLLAF